MQNRKQNPQDILAQKIRILDSNAVFSIRPYDNNEHLAKNPVIRGDYLIDWDDANATECPELAVIEAVSDADVSAMEDAERKRERDTRYKDDLRMKASFLIEKKANPDLKFSDYLDQLEAEEV